MKQPKPKAVILKSVIPAFAGLTLLVQSSLYAAPEYIPVLQGHFTTGQWYSQGNRSSMAGNAGITFVPAVRYSNRFSIIPTVDSSYRGTRSAEELAGGSTLFQDTWENGIGLKAVHGLTENWKLKERFGARMKWYRETTDENWNDGLYDYRSFTLGTEIEYQWRKNLSAGLSYDASYLQFPNYVSLEASSPNNLAREFAGENPLDNFINVISMKGSAPLGWNMRAQTNVYYSPRFYKDQTVVEVSGLLSSTKRSDDATGAALSVNRPFRTSETTTLLVGIDYGHSQLKSNQNHYDARTPQFVANYYDYSQNRVGGSLSLAFGRAEAGPMVIDSGYSYSHRNYSDRPIQSATGAYLSEKLHVIDTQFSAGFSYPITKTLRLHFNTAVGETKSNNQYEEVYRYNFHNANYQFGFTYDY